MLFLMKNFVKDFCPPILFFYVKKILRRIMFIGSYHDWHEALQNCSSYNDEKVFDKVIESARKVRDGLAVYERDSVIFKEIQYDWKLLSALMLVANTQNRLNVIDFGGGLGTSYRQNLKFLNVLKCKKKWMVIEQKKFVAVGISEFTTDELSFYDSIASISSVQADICILGSSLCYMEEPYNVLSSVLELKPKYILINRTPFAMIDEEYISIEKVFSNIYNASYPFWTLSKAKVIDFLKPQYEIFEQWDDSIQAYNDKSLGLFFKLIERDLSKNYVCNSDLG